ncbi:hypothetical protein AB0K51_16385 [Kitasatospora sp. NPDC049285]|uniref:hypothetical protein n=1 Tax=Kitasatospora sp. NPDC049285 TaxID=3157096 RepID=UPI00342F241A
MTAVAGWRAVTYSWARAMAEVGWRAVTAVTRVMTDVIGWRAIAGSWPGTWFTRQADTPSPDPDAGYD